MNFPIQFYVGDKTHPKYGEHQTAKSAEDFPIGVYIVIVQKPVPVASTSAAEWRVKGEEDPHAGLLDVERAKLPMGDYTDDQLANAVFMYGNVEPTLDQLLSGTAKTPLVYLTAAKERIRWLSRQLDRALKSCPNCRGIRPEQNWCDTCNQSGVVIEEKQRDEQNIR